MSHVIECEGRTYRAAAKFTRLMKKDWAAWVYARYREIARADHEEDDTPEALQADLDLLRDMHARGEFGLLSERGVAMMPTNEGTLLLVSLIFGIDDEEAADLLIGAASEVSEVVKSVLQASFPRPRPGAAPDPNARPPRGWLPLRPLTRTP